MEGSRVLVVGASVSIGAALTTDLTRAGSRVAIAARRQELLDEVAAAAGASVATIRCDITDEAECEALVETAVGHLGGLDAVVYLPSVMLLRRLDAASASDWHRTLDTGLVGAACTIRSALPHLRSSGGRVVVFTSSSTWDLPHWPGLALYSVAKVALDRLVQCWRTEIPEVGFTTIELGPTDGSDSPNAGGWDDAQIEEFVMQWVAAGRVGATQPLQVVVDAIEFALSSPSYVEHMSVHPVRASAFDAASVAEYGGTTDAR